MPARFLVACAVACFAVSVRADDADIKKNAKTQAEEIQNALIKGDFGKVIDLTHPNAVKVQGGKQKWIAGATKEWKAMKDKGIELKSVKILDPCAPVRVGNDVYIVVPYSLEITVPDGRGTSKGAIIGVSGDGGEKWVFIDAGPGRLKLKKLLPELPDALIIPKNEPPMFVKD